MKKSKLLVALGLMLAVGFSGSLAVKQTYVAKADDEITETTPIDDETNEDDEEIVVSDTDLLDTLSQTAKDTIEVLKAFFSQPLVIGGVSTTLGAICLSIIVKAFGGALSKKQAKQVLENTLKIGECATQKDYEQLKLVCKQQQELLSQIVPTIKNVNVKASCEKLLVEMQPVVDEVKSFVEQEIKDVKQEGVVVSNQIKDILEK